VSLAKYANMSAYIKLSHYTPRRHLGEEEVYSSYSFSNSALDGGEWSVYIQTEIRLRANVSYVWYVQRSFSVV